MLTEEMKRYVLSNPNDAKSRIELCVLCEFLYDVDDQRTCDEIWDFAAVNSNLPIEHKEV